MSSHHSKPFKIHHPVFEALEKQMNRRDFLFQSAFGLGALAAGNLLAGCGRDEKKFDLNKAEMQQAPLNMLPHFIPKAKRVVYLCMSGGPSQLESFDYKPGLRKYFGQNLPDSVRNGQRLTGMSANQSHLPVAPSAFTFSRHGRSGTWISELLPYTAEVVDELCILKSVHSEAINHDPALTFFQTGNQLPGRPSIGSWISYGLGTANKNLPSFIVLVSKDAPRDQPLYARLWGNGFLPSEHQGVQFRSGRDPVLFLNNPEGYQGSDRREMLEYLKKLNELQNETIGDPEINARMAQYEMAFRMQTSVPEVMDLSDEPEEVFELYGEASRDPGTYAANCILARKLLERDVTFVQLYHQGWDHHGSLPENMKSQCKVIDQPTAAFIKDLKRRGLLEDTLVIWGGEFGRTVYSQGILSNDNYGRDHHPRCFSMWMAGAGVKPGFSYGETDDFSYNIVNNPVHVHDFQATLLHLMGINHEELVFKFQGRRYRLTDVHGTVVHDILT
jgi:hypothetical protein